MKTSSRRQPIDASSLTSRSPGAADERPALAILVEARALADEDDLGVGVALARDGLGARLVQTTLRADPDLGGDLLERRPALGVGHAVASVEAV